MQDDEEGVRLSADDLRECLSSVGVPIDPVVLSQLQEQFEAVYDRSLQRKIASIESHYQTVFEDIIANETAKIEKDFETSMRAMKCQHESETSELTDEVNSLNAAISELEQQAKDIFDAHCSTLEQQIAALLKNRKPSCHQETQTEVVEKRESPVAADPPAISQPIEHDSPPDVPLPISIPKHKVQQPQGGILTPICAPPKRKRQGKVLNDLRGYINLLREDSSTPKMADLVKQQMLNRTERRPPPSVPAKTPATPGDVRFPSRAPPPRPILVPTADSPVLDNSKMFSPSPLRPRHAQQDNSTASVLDDLQKAVSEFALITGQ